jgi:hypothetical protein
MRRFDGLIDSTSSWFAGHGGAWYLGAALVWMTAASAWGQVTWNSGNAGSIYYNGGNVGMGTGSPETRLHVEGFSLFHTDDWGNDALIIRGQKSTSGLYGEYAIRPWYAGLTFRNTQTDALMLFLGQTGNVGIGTVSPQYLLAVNGTIGAKDVVVTNTGWADYVFQAGYRLRPLSEVKSYIEKNRRLPDIPSEAEVKEKGVSVGEMQAKLLAKVEELTLHMIQQEAENRELRGRLAQLETRAASGSAPISGR